MNETPYQPPIPTPDGTLLNEPQAPLGPVTWKDAPLVVRGWAYPLMWLFGIVLLSQLIVAIIPRYSMTERVSIVIGVVVLSVFAVWHAKGLKNRSKVAWTVQIVLSILGLFAFPLGTLIHGYVLSQWFKPPTKAWFGRR